MALPYLKKIKEFPHGITVFEVDGDYVRTNVDTEFVNFGHHHKHQHIPENEFWIDKERVPGEEKFFIDHLLVEHRLMTHGKSFKEASDFAERVEKREREKSYRFKKVAKIAHSKEFLEKIHKDILGTYGFLTAWVVDGELIRDFLYINFTEGGHDLVYSFIPDFEVWIDNDLLENERLFVLLHELHERNLMAQGWCYDLPSETSDCIQGTAAHQSASEIEYRSRHKPDLLLEHIQKETELAKHLKRTL